MFSKALDVFYDFRLSQSSLQDIRFLLIPTFEETGLFYKILISSISGVEAKNLLLLTHLLRKFEASEPKDKEINLGATKTVLPTSQLVWN